MINNKALEEEKQKDRQGGKERGGADEEAHTSLFNWSLLITGVLVDHQLLSSEHICL